jgi:GNAT superfamily N-acetyltransferase
MDYRIYIGKEIEPVLLELAALRISEFLDFPYLYEGTIDYEMEYLKTYVNSERSFLFAVFDNGKMVGATTCIPLSDETEDVQDPFLKNNIAFEDVFYFGESILLKKYRGKGLGVRFFEEREKHAKSFGTFKSTWFCGVKRPEDHPLKPKDFVPLENFWTKRGYRRAENLVSYFEWKDIDEQVSSKKPMMYWKKNI